MMRIVATKERCMMFKRLLRRKHGIERELMMR